MNLTKSMLPRYICRCHLKNSNDIVSYRGLPYVAFGAGSIRTTLRALTIPSCYTERDIHRPAPYADIFLLCSAWVRENVRVTLARHVISVVTRRQM